MSSGFSYFRVVCLQSSSIRLNDFVITGLDKTKCAIVPSESNLFEELVTVVRRYYSSRSTRDVPLSS